MKINSNISFTIPTYNRAEFLDSCLENKINIVQKYSIAIYISDNASTDNTRDIVEKWQKIYPYLYYHRNDTNLDMDGNFEIALNLPNTEYIWLFGDTYQIKEESLAYILTLLNKKDHDYDAIVFNLENLISSPTKNYMDQNELLCDLSGLMSCIACLVYNKKVIKNALFSRYKNTFFSLEAIIFEYIADKKFIVHWTQTESVKGLSLKGKLKKNWSNSNRMLMIGVEGWLKFIYALPASYSLESKFSIHKLFGKVSGLLSYRGLLVRRGDNALTLSSLKKYYHSFILTAGVFKFLFAVMICLIPSSFIKVILDTLKNKI